MPAKKDETEIQSTEPQGSQSSEPESPPAPAKKSRATKAKAAPAPLWSVQCSVPHLAQFKRRIVPVGEPGQSLQFGAAGAFQLFQKHQPAGTFRCLRGDLPEEIRADVDRGVLVATRLSAAESDGLREGDVLDLESMKPERIQDQ